MNKQPRWYHWTLLALCSAGMLTIGILNVTGGASPSSRFYVLDDVVVRLLGVGFMVFSLAVFLRRRWAFLGAIWCLSLSILEILVTYDLGASAPALTAFMLLATLVCIVIFFGIPIALLAWLKTVFVNRGTEPAPGHVPSKAAADGDL